MKCTVAVLSAAIVALTVALCRADYASEVMADAPMAYYRFEESTNATTIADSSGNGHGSLEVSNVVFGTAGRVGRAARFSNAYVRVDLQLDPAVGDLTVEALLRFNDLSIQRNFVSQQDGTGQGRSLLYLENDNLLRSFLGGTTTKATNAVSQATWHHVVMTVANGGASDILTLYLDGQVPDTADLQRLDAHESAA